MSLAGLADDAYNPRHGHPQCLPNASDSQAHNLEGKNRQCGDDDVAGEELDDAISA